MFQSTTAADEAALGERNRREREMTQQLTQLVQEMGTGFQRTSQVQQENTPHAGALSVPWLEAPLTPSESLYSTLPLPWLDPPTPTTSVNPAELPPADQTISQNSIWPPRRNFNLDQIRRRAERMALEHIETQLRERLRNPDRGPTVRRSNAGGVWISISQHGRMSRRIHISDREVHLFVMQYELERLQQEIELVCSGRDNTNDWDKN